MPYYTDFFSYVQTPSLLDTKNTITQSFFLPKETDSFLISSTSLYLLAQNPA